MAMKIKTLFSSSKKWMQGDFAENKYGKHVNSNSKSAVRWCLLGAIAKCYPNPDEANEIEDIVALAIPRDYCGVSSWNDSGNRKFSDIKKLVTKLDI